MSLRPSVAHPVVRVAATVLLAVMASGRAARAGVPAGYLDRVLGNGMQVSILPDSTLPIVATRLWYHVGAANEAPNTRGFAHLFEHLMFGGTTTQPRGAWEAHHHRLGGDENASTYFDETRYESDIPPAGLDSVLVMEADRMMNLRLDQENLDNEKRIVTEELRATSENDPFDRVMVAALKKLCGDHPYALTPLGTKQDIAAATLPLAKEFYARYYRPKNAHLVIAGPVNGPATLALVERRFGSLPADGTVPAEVPELDRNKLPRHIQLKEDLPPAEVGVLVYPLPPPRSKDDVALTVMEQLLTSGQVDAFREDLVRRRHQALEAGTQVLMLRHGGILCFYSAVLPYRRKSGQFDVMSETMTKLATLDWLTDAALAGVKQTILRRVENRRYFAGSMATAIAENQWWRGDSRLAFLEADRVRGITRADVEAVYHRYVADVEPIRVYIQPEKVPIMLTLFGWLLPLFLR